MRIEHEALQTDGEFGCRLEDPDKFDEFRRVSGEGDAPDVIVGITDEGSVAQSFRFPADSFSEERARKFCQERGGKFDANPAGGDEESKDTDQQEDRTINAPTAKRSHDSEVASEPERRELFGREHVVLPMTSLQEMVIEGEFISEEALQESVEHGKWDGKPLVLGHNVTDDGEWRSASEVEFADQNQIGHTRNTSLEDGRLRPEAWIDVEMAKRTEGGQLVLDRIENGDLPIEVSAAYETTLLDESGEHDGKRFGAKQAEIFPDHVAVLVEEHERGKCSIEDGCGLGRMNSDGIHVHGVDVEMAHATLSGPESDVCDCETVTAFVLSESRRPTFSGKTEGEVPDSWPPSLEDFIRANDWDAENWDDLSDDQKQQVVNHTLLGEPADTFAASMMFPVVDTDGNLRENALEAVLSGRGAQADIPDDALESARSMARRLLEDVFGRDVEENSTSNSDDSDTSDGDGSMDDANDDGAAANADDQNDDGAAADAGGQNNDDTTRQDGSNLVDRLRDVLSDLMTTDSEEQTAMNRIEALADGDNPFDREALEAMSEEQLDAIANQFLDNDADADGDTDADTDASDDDGRAQSDDADAEDDEPADDDARANADDADDMDADADADADTSDDGTDTTGRGLSEDERELLEKLLEEKKAEMQSREARKNELVDDLDERQDVSLPREDLEAMSVEGLEELRDRFDREATFVGRGGRAQRDRSEKSYFDENPTTPGVLLKDDE